MDKTFNTCDETVFDAFDGAVVIIGGFFSAEDIPVRLVEALRRQGVKNLTLVNNGAGTDENAMGGLMKDGAVSKLVSSFPNSPGATEFRKRYLAGEIELELVPQGTLAERIRAGGAGIGGFYTKTGVGTEVAKGKEIRVIDGQEFIFEKPIFADFALIKAQKGDRFGNLCYRGTMRNFNMVAATAARVVIAEVEELVPVGTLSPEEIHTPGIFVNRVVLTEKLHMVGREEGKKVNA